MKLTEKFMTKFSLVVWIGLVVGTADLRAAFIGIYVPAGSRAQDGDSSFDGSPGYGYQQLFPADWFADLPKGGAILGEVVFRSDASFFGQLNWSDSVTGVEIGVSTTQRLSSSLSAIFAENVGDDRALLTRSTDSRGISNLPRGIGIPSEFSLGFGSSKDGFLYDPAVGNLLLDIKGLGFPFAIDAFTTAENIAVTFSSVDPDFSKGTLLHKGLAVAFAFYPVPEPSSIVLLAAGVLAFVISRQPHQRKVTRAIGC
jgi:PEP-CTERM motif